jgi:uncharacterized membrane protein YraQ (UPF0718 family)
MAVDALAPARSSAARQRSVSPQLLAVIGVAAAAGTLRLLASASPRVVSAELAFVSLFVESLPFLLVGALLSNVLRTRRGQEILTAAARRPRLAGALAPFAGLGLPLCDCGLLPLAREMRGRGLSRAVNGFLAGAPLTNPIVIVTTLLAFPHSPGMVVARVACGFAIAAVVGAVMAGPADVTRPEACGNADHDHGDQTGWLSAVGRELTRTGPALAIGAAMAASIKAAVPTSALTSLDHQPLIGAAALMLLAFVMSICSQADAFVAAALPVGALPQLAFLVLGPVLDLRLAVLYRREFGWRWVLSYAAVVVPVALVAVTVCATAGLI